MLFCYKQSFCETWHFTHAQSILVRQAIYEPPPKILSWEFHVKSIWWVVAEEAFGIKEETTLLLLHVNF